MTELNSIIKIETSKGGKHIVNARDVWQGLGSKQDFSNWIKNKLLGNFEYNKDYSIIEYDLQGSIIPNNRIIEPDSQRVRVQKRDFPITLDTAKHLALMENTARGKEIRAYFIECEKKLNSPTQQVPTTFSQALKLAYEQSITIELQDAKIANDAPLVLFAKKVEASADLILIRDLAKLLAQKGMDIGERRLFAWLRDNKFITKVNTPTQKAINLKVLELVETVYSDDRLSKTTKVTGKGQVYFINKLTINN